MKIDESEVQGPYLRRAWEYVGLPRSTFYARVKGGDLPEGIRLGGKAVVWPKATLDAFVRRCASGMVGGEEVNA